MADLRGFGGRLFGDVDGELWLSLDEAIKMLGQPPHDETAELAEDNDFVHTWLIRARRLAAEYRARESGKLIGGM